MNKGEANLWKRLRNNMLKRGYWCEARRHEDMYSGVADVSFVCRKKFHHWLELKYLAEYPKRSTTPVRLRHFRTEQRNFIYEKGRAAGRTWIILQVEDDHYLFDWTAAHDLGSWTREELRVRSVDYWDGRLRYDELSFCFD